MGARATTSVAPTLKLRVVSEMCLRGPGVCRVPVEIDSKSVPIDVWVESASLTDDCQIVEGNLADVCYKPTEFGFCGELMIAVPTGVGVYLQPGDEPWCLRPATS